MKQCKPWKCLESGRFWCVSPKSALKSESAEKVVDLGIHYLCKEAAESLEETIDRIATEAVGRALQLQR